MDVVVDFQSALLRILESLFAFFLFGNISNLSITGLVFYSHILNINTGFFYTTSFRRIHLSVCIYRLTENVFTGPKVSGAFEKRGPGLELLAIEAHARENHQKRLISSAFQKHSI